MDIHVKWLRPVSSSLCQTLQLVHRRPNVPTHNSRHNLINVINVVIIYIISLHLPRDLKLMNNYSLWICVTVTKSYRQRVQWVTKTSIVCFIVLFCILHLQLSFDQMKFLHKCARQLYKNKKNTCRRILLYSLLLKVGNYCFRFNKKG